MIKFLASAVVSMLFICSCTKETFTNEQMPPANRIVANNASLNVVQPYKEHYDIDLSEGWSEINSCNGEILEVVEGIWHLTLHALTTPDGRVIVKVHNNTSKYKLVNETTGVEYTGSYVSNDQFSFNTADPADSSPFEESITLSVILTTPGGDNNSTLKVTYHITFNANNVPTAAWFENYRSGCQ